VKYFTGYYGACNEELMRITLVHGGPISVSFEVYPDFSNYKSGIYHHTGLGEFRPFEVSTCALSFQMPDVSVTGFHTKN
jgi:cathepsin C